MSFRNWNWSGLLGVWLVLANFPGWAQETEPTEDQYQEHSEYGPIQKRLYRMDHELAFGFSYLPLDPYVKGYGVQLAYTIHFNPVVALELFRVGYQHNVDTGLKDRLLNAIPDITPEEFPAIILYENTNLLFNLFYGKSSFLNRKVAHYEIFGTIGGAFLYRNPFNDTFSIQDKNTRIDLGVNVGVGFRFWLNTNWSVRCDIRDTFILWTVNKTNEFPLKSSAMVGLLLAVNL